MDQVNRSAVTPSKKRLARTFAKVLHIRALTGGVTPADGVQKPITHEPIKHSSLIKDLDQPKSFEEEDAKPRRKAAATEALLAKLFASVSSVKAAYAELQFAQSPYDADGIQSADKMIILELKSLYELKQCYLKNHFDESSSPETTQLLAEIQEQKSVSKTFEIMARKLDSQLKLKKSELTFLREKLEEANKENKLLEKRLSSSGQLSVLENIRFSSLTPSHFIAVLRQTVKTIRSFVRLMVSEIEYAGWDLDSAANSIEPGVVFSSMSHKCLAFESFVCRVMFDGFNYPNFSPPNQSLSDKKRPQRQFFDRFVEQKSLKPKEYLRLKPKSKFANFCRIKYLELLHPKMESSLFGNLNQRNLVNSGDFPETTFFATFSEMAKRVWLLHCLAFSFKPEASIFQVPKKSRYSEVYMVCVNEEAFFSSADTQDTHPLVAFTVVPGFKIGKTVIQSQVYLC